MTKSNIFKIAILSITILVLYFVIRLFFIDNITHSEYSPLIQKNSSCISCHTPMTGFSDAHSPSKITCISCHLGNNISLKKEKAHKNMVTVPGNLSNVSKTCAKCHVGIDIRVKKSLMNTMSGIISVDKYLFNENDNLDSLFNIHHLQNKTLAESHLRNKCASCHIGNEKHHPNPITQKTRGGGCTACHLNYSDDGKNEHQKYIASNKLKLPKIHPSLSLKITDNHCFGCHSRSGRIATNYEGWHETIFKDTLYNNPNYRVLEDKRVFEKQPADIHHTKGLSCIDCHDSNDVMGDGQTYAHQEEAVNTNCNDCHFSSDANAVSFSELALDEQRIIKLKKIDTSYLFVYAKKSDKILLNVIHKNETNYLITKNTNQQLLLSKPADNCTKEVHQNINCSTCHTKWAPQCISCHTSFDKNEDGFDLLDKEWNIGTWVEKASDYLAAYPTLGVYQKKGEKEIKTFAPGMIMHLQKDTKKTDFHRLFAPISAHTISKKGKNCIDCHNNPVALGYGRGKLSFKKGRWKFTPKYTLEKDGLPKDAWIPFLKKYSFAKSTRKNARPFTVKEQRTILRVGACLTCHKENSEIANSMLENFKGMLKNKSTDCIIPIF